MAQSHITTLPSEIVWPRICRLLLKQPQSARRSRQRALAALAATYRSLSEPAPDVRWHTLFLKLQKLDCQEMDYEYSRTHQHDQDPVYLSELLLEAGLKQAEFDYGG